MLSLFCFHVKPEVTGEEEQGEDHDDNNYLGGWGNLCQQYENKAQWNVQVDFDSAIVSINNDSAQLMALLTGQ